MSYSTRLLRGAPGSSRGMPVATLANVAYNGR